MLYERVGWYSNFFQPTAKLIAKIRTGARVTKRYDRAQTPYQRLRAADGLSAVQKATLEERYLSLNPSRLREQIQEALTALWNLAEQPGK